MTAFNKKTFFQDFLASMVVFLVALPLCLGIAIASGAPPITGLIAGIIGGLVVGSVTGSPLQVSGPAAGLAVMVFEVINEQGFIALGLVVLIAGAFQFLGSVLKLGNYFKAVSPAVVKGMLSGIGVLILASQFHVMLDHNPDSSGVTNLATMFQALLDVFDVSNGVQHIEAATIGLITIVCLVGWNLLKNKVKLPIPAPLVAIIVATAIANLDALAIKYIDLPQDIMGTFNFDVMGRFQSLSWSVLFSGLAFALVATTETLLCVSAVDSIVPDHKSDYDKELRAQGLGNMAAGLLGVLPVTGVIVRSSANIEFGGKTKASTIMHGIWLVLFLFLFSDVLRMIPTSALAAILVYTGYKLIDVKVTRDFYKFDRTEAIIYIVTVGAIVGTNLLYGVLIGYALSLVQQVYRLNQFEMSESDQGGDHMITAKGVVTFLSLPKLSEAVDQSLEKHGKVIVNFTEVRYMDNAAQDYVEQITVQEKERVSIRSWENMTQMSATP